MNFLTEEIKEYLKESLGKKRDVLKVAEHLAKKYPIEERREILDYFKILPKIFEKFQTSEFLFCDALALEQSTAKDIGIAKANLLKNFSGEIHDLCCGMGGDSFFLPENLKPIGIDLDKKRLEMYSFNLKVFGKNIQTFLADARTFYKERPAPYFTIDPARRKEKTDNQRQLENLTPSFAEVLEISRHYKGGMVKLPPAFPLNDIPENAEIIYLGSKKDCRECLVLFGEFATRKNSARALAVDNSGEILAEYERPNFKTANIALRITPLLKYIIEPAPLLVRSRVFENLAQKHDASLISAGIAYLTSNEKIPEFGFRHFEVLEEAPLKTPLVKKMLKKFDIGRLTLKKRGVEITPEEEIKRLAPKGNSEAILFYTRISGEKRAILAREVI